MRRRKAIGHSVGYFVKKNWAILSYWSPSESRTKIIKTSKSKYMSVFEKKFERKVDLLMTLSDAATHVPKWTLWLILNLIDRCDGCIYNSGCDGSVSGSCRGVARFEWKHLPILSWKDWADEIIYFPMSLCVQISVALWVFCVGRFAGDVSIHPFGQSTDTFNVAGFEALWQRHTSCIYCVCCVT